MKRFAIIVVLAIIVGLPSCRRPMPLPSAPRPRIVSFSPALTTMLFDMHLGDHVVGVTTQDRLPAGASRPVVGDVFSVSAEGVLAVRPDVLVTNIHVAHFVAVARIDPNIRIEYIRLETFDDVATAMQRLAEIAGAPQRGIEASAAFLAALDRIRASVADKPRPKVLFITTFEALGVAGRGTFLDDMIRAAGGVNVAERYVGWGTITAEGILAAAPDVVICQVGGAAEARRAERFFASLKGLPAVESGRVHVMSDLRWTIPSGALAGFTADLAAIIHPQPTSGAAHDE